MEKREQEHRQRVIAGALKRMMQRELSAGWNTWRTKAGESKAAKAALRRGAMRLTSQKLAAALWTWRLNTDSTKGVVERYR